MNTIRQQIITILLLHSSKRDKKGDNTHELELRPVYFYLRSETRMSIKTKCNIEGMAVCKIFCVCWMNEWKMCCGDVVWCRKRNPTVEVREQRRMADRLKIKNDPRLCPSLTLCILLLK